MTRRRGRDSNRGKPTAGTPPRPTEMQARKRTRGERPSAEKQKQNDPDAIDRDDVKTH
jgi:hypothetical protein